MRQTEGSDEMSGTLLPRVGTPMQVALLRLQLALTQWAEAGYTSLSPEVTKQEFQNPMTTTGLSAHGLPRQVRDVYYAACARVESGIEHRNHVDFLLHGLQRAVADSIKELFVAAS